MTKSETRGNGTQASVHLVLQGKGGVGKSFVSAILAQYFRTKSARVHCMDTDPVNATFAQYRLLEAEHLKVLRRGRINEKEFDVFVQRVCCGEGVFIVDTGATTFVPLWNFILENEILEMFQTHQRRVFVHSVVAGGQAMSDTLNGLERLAQTTSQKNVIVWINEYFGEVTKDGKTFEEFKIAEEYAHKLVGSVLIRDRRKFQRIPAAGRHNPAGNPVELRWFAGELLYLAVGRLVARFQETCGLPHAAGL